MSNNAEPSLAQQLQSCGCAMILFPFGVLFFIIGVAILWSIIAPSDSGKTTSTYRDEIAMVQRTITSGVRPTWEAAPLRGGVAVLGSNDAAYWVYNGRVHAANGWAMTHSPEIRIAPPNVSFDEVTRSIAGESIGFSAPSTTPKQAIEDVQFCMEPKRPEAKFGTFPYHGGIAVLCSIDRAVFWVNGRLAVFFLNDSADQLAPAASDGRHMFRAAEVLAAAPESAKRKAWSPVTDTNEQGDPKQQAEALADALKAFGDTPENTDKTGSGH